MLDWYENKISKWTAQVKKDNAEYAKRVQAKGMSPEELGVRAIVSMCGLFGLGALLYAVSMIFKLEVETGVVVGIALCCVIWFWHYSGRFLKWRT